LNDKKLISKKEKKEKKHKSKKHHKKHSKKLTVVPEEMNMLNMNPSFNPYVHSLINPQLISSNYLNTYNFPVSPLNYVIMNPEHTVSSKNHSKK